MTGLRSHDKVQYELTVSLTVLKSHDINDTYCLVFKVTVFIRSHDKVYYINIEQLYRIALSRLDIPYFIGLHPVSILDTQVIINLVLK